MIHPLKLADEHPEWPRWRVGTLTMIKVPYNEETKEVFGNQHAIILFSTKHNNVSVISGTKEKIDKYWTDRIPPNQRTYFRDTRNYYASED